MSFVSKAEVSVCVGGGGVHFNYVNMDWAIRRTKLLQYSIIINTILKQNFIIFTIFTYIILLYSLSLDYYIQLY